ncbi:MULTISPECIES: hypothetical protein [Streptomyces]|jgi:hypothetical protein|uniref:Uncharacterized protein n=1 Tax=Streptomyces fradiae ATCC 10745 = DSM 40063 TaxID=1319510 RepID=A0A1Y2P2Q6_STRFR|nr:MULTISPECIES: hypothetical protein [Streptomyces]KAF0646751.1 hypothetical protein K701_26930 [Streptomyces fradiae ATCC 10745 = DSM 40063]OSY53517.1 hypothetical protein BG846_00791 [Streptomyces fradiae ATCC 10745 = DSM 40063]QEV12995.1 hypothetical protein CP974_14505 [Streptomyces fradiae ATCC 10745 = DSM 40063]WOI58526.1 hypothetical protein RYQ63_00400 [Streptomyces fradiae]
MTIGYDAEADREARSTVNELRIVLGSHGIKLPSLGRDYGDPPLITLGNCNLATARALVDVLRRA